MARVPGVPDTLTAGDAVTDLDERAVLLQVIVLARRAVVVQDDDVVGVAAAAVTPATDVVGFFDACHDAGARRVHRCSLGHVEIDSIGFEAGMAEP